MPGQTKQATAVALTDLHRSTARAMGLSMADDGLASLLNTADDGMDDTSTEDQRLQGSALPAVSEGTSGKTPPPTEELPEEAKKDAGAPADLEDLKMRLKDISGKAESKDDQKKAGDYLAKLEELLKEIPDMRKFADSAAAPAAVAPEAAALT